MGSKWLARGDAPFSGKVWEHIDKAAVGAARSQLSCRRLLDIEGPYGLGMKVIPGLDVTTKEETKVGDAVATVSAPRMTVMASIVSEFAIPTRDIAAMEENGVAFETTSVAEAAIACARQEDAILLNGSRALGADGLTTASGAGSYKLKSWKDVGVAADDAIAAVTGLDEAGLHGPYALALAPSLYNLLHRRYPQGPATEMDHVKSICTAGVVKAPALDQGGVLIATGRQYLSIALGQDLMVGFIGPAGDVFEFTVSESLALRIKQPKAICVLKTK